MFVVHTENTGIKIPPDPNNYEKHEYPHWAVFITIHCGHAFDYTVLEENARIIASIPDDKIKEITLDDLKELGCDVEPNMTWD